MVLLSDFFKCFDFEHISCSDVFKRLNFYYLDKDENGNTYVPFDYVGVTTVFFDSFESSKVIYLFRFRGEPGPHLLNLNISELLKSVSLYCRPKRAWRDWFENVLLPH